MIVTVRFDDIGEDFRCSREPNIGVDHRFTLADNERKWKERGNGRTDVPDNRLQMETLHKHVFENSVALRQIHEDVVRVKEKSNSIYHARHANFGRNQFNLTSIRSASSLNRRSIRIGPVENVRQQRTAVVEKHLFPNERESNVCSNITRIYLRSTSAIEWKYSGEKPTHCQSSTSVLALPDLMRVFPERVPRRCAIKRYIDVIQGHALNGRYSVDSEKLNSSESRRVAGSGERERDNREFEGKEVNLEIRKSARREEIGEDPNASTNRAESPFRLVEHRSGIDRIEGRSGYLSFVAVNGNNTDNSVERQAREKERRDRAGDSRYESPSRNKCLLGESSKKKRRNKVSPATATSGIDLLGSRAFVHLNEPLENSSMGVSNFNRYPPRMEVGTKEFTKSHLNEIMANSPRMANLAIDASDGMYGIRNGRCAVSSTEERTKSVLNSRDLAADSTLYLYSSIVVSDVGRWSRAESMKDREKLSKRSGRTRVIVRIIRDCTPRMITLEDSTYRRKNRNLWSLETKLTAPKEYRGKNHDFYFYRSRRPSTSNVRPVCRRYERSSRFLGASWRHGQSHDSYNLINNEVTESTYDSLLWNKIHPRGGMGKRIEEKFIREINAPKDEDEAKESKVIDVSVKGDTDHESDGDQGYETATVLSGNRTNKFHGFSSRGHNNETFREIMQESGECAWNKSFPSSDYSTKDYDEASIEGTVYRGAAVTNVERSWSKLGGFLPRYVAATPANPSSASLSVIQVVGETEGERVPKERVKVRGSPDWRDNTNLVAKITEITRTPTVVDCFNVATRPPVHRTDGLAALKNVGKLDASPRGKISGVEASDTGKIAATKETSDENAKRYSGNAPMSSAGAVTEAATALLLKRSTDRTTIEKETSETATAETTRITNDNFRPPIESPSYTRMQTLAGAEFHREVFIDETTFPDETDAPPTVTDRRTFDREFADVDYTAIGRTEPAFETQLRICPNLPVAIDTGALEVVTLTTPSMTIEGNDLFADLGFKILGETRERNLYVNDLDREGYGAESQDSTVGMYSTVGLLSRTGNMDFVEEQVGATNVYARRQRNYFRPTTSRVGSQGERPGKKDIETTKYLSRNDRSRNENRLGAIDARYEEISDSENVGTTLSSGYSGSRQAGNFNRVLAWHGSIASNNSEEIGITEERVAAKSFSTLKAERHAGRILPARGDSKRNEERDPRTENFSCVSRSNPTVGRVLPRGRRLLSVFKRKLTKRKNIQKEKRPTSKKRDDTLEKDGREKQSCLTSKDYYQNDDYLNPGEQEYDDVETYVDEQQLDDANNNPEVMSSKYDAATAMSETLVRNWVDGASKIDDQRTDLPYDPRYPGTINFDRLPEPSQVRIESEPRSDLVGYAKNNVDGNGKELEISLKGKIRVEGDLDGRPVAISFGGAMPEISGRDSIDDRGTRDFDNRLSSASANSYDDSFGTLLPGGTADNARVFRNDFDARSSSNIVSGTADANEELNVVARPPLKVYVSNQDFGEREDQLPEGASEQSFRPREKFGEKVEGIPGIEKSRSSDELFETDEEGDGADRFDSISHSSEKYSRDGGDYLPRDVEVEDVQEEAADDDENESLNVENRVPAISGQNNIGKIDLTRSVDNSSYRSAIQFPNVFQRLFANQKPENDAWNISQKTESVAQNVNSSGCYKMNSTVEKIELPETDMVDQKPYSSEASEKFPMTTTTTMSGYNAGLRNETIFDSSGMDAKKLIETKNTLAIVEFLENLAKLGTNVENLTTRYDTIRLRLR